MYESFGAVVSGDSVQFTLFFPDNLVDATQYQRGGSPNIVTLRVAGDFQAALGGVDWDHANGILLVKGAHPKGWVYTAVVSGLPAGFYQYKYFVEFADGTTRWCSDPCGKYGGNVFQNSGFVVGGAVIPVAPLAPRLPLEQLVIYELELDDFTFEYREGRAPLEAVLDKLDYLVELGINAIEFMPWAGWAAKGFSWGYDPVSFFSVEYNYYNDDTDPLVKLRRLALLINALHERGIHVLMDGVYNQAFGGDYPNEGFAYYWLYQNPDDSPYIGAFGAGGFFNEFDFANNCVDEFVIDVCQYWINQYGIDGIRFDYVLGFFVASDAEQGIGEIILYLDSYAKTAGLTNMSWVLELLTDNRYDAINDTNQINASGCWFDPLMWECVNSVRAAAPSPGLLRALDTGKDFALNKYPVVYLENHDHSTVVAACGGRQQWWVVQPAMIALFTCAGAVFLHNGQEFGEEYAFPETGDGRVMARPLRWAKSEDAIGVAMYSLYRRLIALRKANPVLCGHNFYLYGAYGSTVVYHRWGEVEGVLMRYIIVLNFSGNDQGLNVPFSDNGQWEELLGGTVVNVGGYVLPYVVGSHWGAIFRKVG
jgi:pullulanase